MKQPTTDEAIEAFEKLADRLESNHSLLYQLQHVLNLFAWGDDLRPFQQRRVVELKERIARRLEEQQREPFAAAMRA